MNFVFVFFFQFTNSSNISEILKKATVSKKIDVLLDAFRNSQDKVARLNNSTDKEVENLKTIQLYNSELRTNMEIVANKLKHLHNEKEKIFQSLENLQLRLTK